MFWDINIPYFFHLTYKKKWSLDTFLKSPQLAWRLEFDFRNIVLIFVPAGSRGKGIRWVSDDGETDESMFLQWTVIAPPETKIVKHVAPWKSMFLILGTYMVCVSFAQRKTQAV